MRLGWWPKSKHSNTLSIAAAENYCNARFTNDRAALGSRVNDYLVCDEDNLCVGARESAH